MTPALLLFLLIGGAGLGCLGLAWWWRQHYGA
jgi:hypothetical protein